MKIKHCKKKETNTKYNTKNKKNMIMKIKKKKIKKQKK